MEFRTKVELPVGKWNIRHSDRLMLWGSCFAENVGKLLVDSKFPCIVNPYGILYNPMSISRALNEILDGKVYTLADLRCDRGLWYSLMHHGSFSDPDAESCLQRINLRIGEAHGSLPEIRWMVFTFGTARIYEWKETGEVVGNCHKLPEKCFERRLLDVEEIVSTYTRLLEKLHEMNSELQILFTVSPIRHSKDGFHGNQLNKAVLLLAVDKLCGLFDFCHYFPAYEIMMDELRDYRFYADDMLHPSPVAVAYIWECFCSTFFDRRTMAVMKEWDDIRKGLNHVPFNADSESYRSFLSQILLKIERLKENFPYLDVQNEIILCQARLKK